MKEKFLMMGYPLFFVFEGVNMGLMSCPKALKVQEVVLNCLFLETSWANLVTCPSFGTDFDKRDI